MLTCKRFAIIQIHGSLQYNSVCQFIVGFLGIFFALEICPCRASSCVDLFFFTVKAQYFCALQLLLLPFAQDHLARAAKRSKKMDNFAFCILET